MPTKNETIRHDKDNHHAFNRFMQLPSLTGLDYLVDKTVKHIDSDKRLNEIERRLEKLENREQSGLIVKLTQKEIDFYSSKTIPKR